MINSELIVKSSTMKDVVKFVLYDEAIQLI